MKGRGFCIGLAVLALASVAPSQAYKFGWRDIIQVSSASNDRTADTAVDRQGNLYVVGTSTVGPQGNQSDLAFLAKYSATGTRVWRVTLDASQGGGRTTNGLAVAIDGTGAPYIAMSAPVNSTVPQFAIARFNQANGNLVWVRTHLAPNFEAFTPRDLAVDNTGALVAVGGVGMNSRGSFGIIRYTAAGTLLWFRKWAPAGGTEGEAFTLAIGPNNDAYVVGRMNRPGQGLDSAICKVRADGVVLWGNGFGGRVGFGTDRATAVTVNVSGDAYVTGEEYVEGSTSYMYLRRVNGATGASLWHRRLLIPSGNASRGVGVGIDPVGNIAVGGHALISSATRSDLFFMKYNPLGAKLWERAINSAADNEDFANAFAMDQFGNAYVTGYSAPRSGVDRTQRLFTARVQIDGTVGWTHHYRPGFTGDGFDVPSSITVDRILGHAYISAGITPAPTGDGKVLALAQAPQTRDDVYVMNRNTTLTTTAANGVAANDVWRFFCAAGMVGTVSTGTLTLRPDGSFTYTPPRNFTGLVTFRYRLVRSGLSPSSAGVRISVR